MTDHDDRWALVGAAIDARRVALSMTKAELIRAAKVSDKTLDGYISGRPIVREDKARELLVALSWPADAFDRIAAGEDLTEWGGAALSTSAELRLTAELHELRARYDALAAEVRSLRAEHRPSPEPNE